LDLIEAGFTPETALTAISRAIAADPTLREHSTIIAVLTDLKDDGLSDTDALAKLALAITADPTLRNLDDMVEKSPPGTRGRALGRDKDIDRDDAAKDDDEDKDDEDRDDEDRDDDEDSGRQKGRGPHGDRDDNEDKDNDDDSNRPEAPGKGRARGR